MAVEKTIDPMLRAKIKANLATDLKAKHMEIFKKSLNMPDFFNDIEEIEGIKEIKKSMAAKGKTTKEIDAAVEHISTVLKDAIIGNVVFMAEGKTAEARLKNNVNNCKSLISNFQADRKIQADIMQAWVERETAKGTSQTEIKATMDIIGGKFKSETSWGNKAKNVWRKITGQELLPEIKIKPVMWSFKGGKKREGLQLEAVSQMHKELQDANSSGFKKALEEFGKYGLSPEETVSAVGAIKEIAGRISDDSKTKAGILTAMDEATQEYCATPPTDNMEKGQPVKGSEELFDKTMAGLEKYPTPETTAKTLGLDLDSLGVKAPKMEEVYDKGDEKHAQITNWEKQALDRLQKKAPAGKDLVSDYQSAKFLMGKALGLHARIQSNSVGRDYDAFSEAFLEEYEKNPEVGRKDAALITRLQDKENGWEAREKEITLWLRKNNPDSPETVAAINKQVDQIMANKKKNIGEAYQPTVEERFGTFTDLYNEIRASMATKVEERSKLQAGLKQAQAAGAKWDAAISFFKQKLPDTKTEAKTDNRASQSQRRAGDREETASASTPGR